MNADEYMSYRRIRLYMSIAVADCREFMYEPISKWKSSGLCRMMSSLRLSSVIWVNPPAVIRLSFAGLPFGFGAMFE